MAVSRKGIPDEGRRLVPRKASARSRISNGADILPDVDGRSAVARRYRDIAAQIIADMGGASQCAEARLQLIRRFAAAAVLAEQMSTADRTLSRVPMPRPRPVVGGAGAHRNDDQRPNRRLQQR